MLKSEFTFTTPDNVKIFVHKHTPKEKPKAAFVISHGMAEHSQRYDWFAEKLNEVNYIVYAHDHRGHGKTAGKIENLGFFSEQNGWQKVVDDIQQLISIVKEENPDIPVILFGQSMGSFLVRSYISKYGENINGVILSATAGSVGILANIGVLLTKIIIVFNSKRTLSPLMDKIIFGAYNKAFKPNRTKFDWLSRNEKIVDKYVEDPFCGTIFTIGFFKDLIIELESVNKFENVSKVPKDIPMYIYSGNKDPLSKNGKQILKVYDLYKKAGVKRIKMKLYSNARHELHNEINKEEVISDILYWINQNVKFPVL